MCSSDCGASSTVGSEFFLDAERSLALTCTERRHAHNRAKNTQTDVTTTGAKLYVGNIPESMTRQEVFALFAPLGKVMRVHLPSHPGQKGLRLSLITHRKQRNSR